MRIALRSWRRRRRLLYLYDAAVRGVAVAVEAAVGVSWTPYKNPLHRSMYVYKPTFPRSPATLKLVVCTNTGAHAYISCSCNHPSGATSDHAFATAAAAAAASSSSLCSSNGVADASTKSLSFSPLLCFRTDFHLLTDRTHVQRNHNTRQHTRA